MKLGQIIAILALAFWLAAAVLSVRGVFELAGAAWAMLLAAVWCVVAGFLLALVNNGATSG